MVGEDDLVGPDFLLCSLAARPALAQALSEAADGDGSALVDLGLTGDARTDG